MPKLNRKITAVTLVLAATVGTPLFAAAADTIKMRIANYRELGTAFKNINDELRSSSPSTFMIQMSARDVSRAARDQYNWFPAGSGPEAGVKTRAKAEIWATPAKFKSAQDLLATNAEAFAKAAKGGDVGEIRAASKELGRACVTCHRSFREED